MIQKRLIFLLIFYRNFIDCRSFPFDQIVVFGDSNSDNGNVFHLTQGQCPPSPPFDQGRFSDGPMWTEQLNLVRIKNYAYGSGTTDDRLVQGFTETNHTVPGVRQQIRLFHNENRFNVDRTLFLIWAGANDYFFNMNVKPQQVVFSLITDVRDLINIGGKHIVLVNQPPIDRIPIAKLMNKTETWKSIVHEHNKYLIESIRRFNELSSTVDLHFIDIYSFVDFLLSNSNLFGLTNFDRCWDTTREIPRKLCKTLENHLFLDEFHFTSRGHRFVAEFFREILLRLY